MSLTAELSLSQLQDDYVPFMQGFIDDLNDEPSLTVVTNAMSTRVDGDFDRVLGVVKVVLARSVETFEGAGAGVQVYRLRPGDQRRLTG